MNLYWMLRNGRKWDQAHRRKYYRRIEREKKRLIDSGVDPELVRLLCRHLANPRNKRAESIFKNFQSQIKLPFNGLP